MEVVASDAGEAGWGILAFDPPAVIALQLAGVWVALHQSVNAFVMTPRSLPGWALSVPQKKGVLHNEQKA